jgi:hypothetical protein
MPVRRVLWELVRSQRGESETFQATKQAEMCWSDASQGAPTYQTPHSDATWLVCSSSGFLRYSHYFLEATSPKRKSYRADPTPTLYLSYYYKRNVSAAQAHAQPQAQPNRAKGGEVEEAKTLHPPPTTALAGDWSQKVRIFAPLLLLATLKGLYAGCCFPWRRSMDWCSCCRLPCFSSPRVFLTAVHVVSWSCLVTIQRMLLFSVQFHPDPAVWVTFFRRTGLSCGFLSSEIFSRCWFKDLVQC